MTEQIQIVEVESGSSNTLLPVDFDLSIGRLQVSPYNYEKLHTEVHVLWEALWHGRTLKDMTLEALRQAHFEICKGYELLGKKHQKMKNNQLDSEAS